MAYRVNPYVRSKLVVILTGIVMCGLAIAVLINPIAAVGTLVRIIGWVFLGFGIVMLVSAFMKGDPVHNAVSELGLGVVCAILGLVMALAPGVFTTIVWTFIGIVVLATGILDIIEAADARGQGSPLAPAGAIVGFITAILGVIAIVSPLFFPELAMLVAAVVLLVDGITELIFGLGM